MQLNARQRKFAHEYVKNGFVGVLAVYAAGYRVGYDSACVQASRMLRNAKVKSMIDSTIEKARNRAELTAERVSKEIAGIAFTEVETVDLSAKMKALDLATKVLGMQSQKIETVDSTNESALIKSIQSAAKRDNLPPETAAIQLFQALSDDPQFSDLNTWPQEYRAAIQQSQQNTEQITEIGDQ